MNLQDSVEIGRRIRLARHMREMSQGEVANILDLPLWILIAPLNHWQDYMKGVL